jgi:Iodothyronine deiodinase
MIDIYRNYCDKSAGNQVAGFITIYISEAHANDEWYLPTATGTVDIAQHKTIQDRITAGTKFVNDFEFPIEMVLDSMADEASELYDAWPERLYIIEKGVIVYQGGLGPFDYRLAEVKDWLAARYGMRGEPLVTKK